MFLRRLGVLRTPEESGNHTPGILGQRQAFLDWAQGLKREPDCLSALAADPAFNAWHLMQRSEQTENPPFDPALVVARAKATLEADPARLSRWLTPSEKRAFLQDATLVAGLIAEEPQRLHA